MTEETKSETPTEREARKRQEEKDKKALVKKAKLLYFLEYSEQMIATETGLSINTLKYHIHRKANPWRKQRSDGQADLFRQAIEGKRDRAENIVGLSLQALEKYLTRQVTREAEITAKDAKLISDILANTHRIARLEDGEPTDIRRFEQLTPEELKDEARKVLQEIADNDPMMAMPIGDEDEIYRPTGHKKSSVH